MKPENQPTPPPASQFIKPILTWLGLSLVGFGAVALASTWASGKLHVPSPAAAPGPPAGGPGMAAGPGSLPGAGGMSGAGAALGASGDFRLASLDGRNLGPADFQGQVVVIDLWASWCGPCRVQARYFDELHEEFGDGSGVQLLAINSGESEATARRYVERDPFPYPVLLDPRQSVARQYGSSGLPTVLIFDPEGNLAFKRVGVTDLRTLRREIGKARAATGASI